VSNLATTGYGTFESDWDVPSGRHAFIEDAVLTPIFHALTRGGLRDQRPEPAAPARPAVQPDPVETFRRDPLTAPIPVQALVAVPSQPWRRAPADLNPAGSRRRAERGRHHHRLEAVGY
jgi:hypothetical protein